MALPVGLGDSKSVNVAILCPLHNSLTYNGDISLLGSSSKCKTYRYNIY